MEQLCEEFAAVETMLALGHSRGDAAWWTQLSQGAASLTGGLPPVMETVELVCGVWEEAWVPRWAQHDASRGWQLSLGGGPRGGGEAELRERNRELRNRLVVLSKQSENAAIPRKALPDRPVLAETLAVAQQLGEKEEETLPQEEANEEIIGEHLSHLDPALVQAARRRAAAAQKRLDPEAGERRRRERLPGLCEQIRGLCALNKRHRWPLVVLIPKLVERSSRPGVREETLGLLQLLALVTEDWIRVIENTHADGGIFVHVQKKDFPKALAKAVAAAAVVDPLSTQPMDQTQ